MSEPTYEKCAHCHLFIWPNTSFDLYPDAGYAEWDHLADLDDESELATDESHDAAPSGEVHTLDYWRQYGPAEMRARSTL